MKSQTEKKLLLAKSDYLALIPLHTEKERKKASRDVHKRGTTDTRVCSKEEEEKFLGKKSLANET